MPWCIRAGGFAFIGLLTLVASDAVAQDRPEVTGNMAAVVASHPLAAAAGADVLRRGGNAIDAAITMAAVLSVVRPHMNGVGGDAFLLYRDAASGRTYAINGSGRAPALATPEQFATRGHLRVPGRGILSVSVPGAPRLWSDALARFGSIGFADALAPAIDYAENGFIVSDKLSRSITSSRENLAETEAMRAVFLPDGSAPAPGSLLVQRDLAGTLATLAREGIDAFYEGEIARRIVAFMGDSGLVRLPDLRAHTTQWQEPIETDYHGYRILTAPPNSQGLALLLQMNMAERFDLKALGHNSAEYVHTLVEIKKLAFAERDRYVTDPDFFDVPVELLLSKEHARALLDTVGVGERAAVVQPVEDDDGGDTAFLTVVDAAGHAVSLIQSLASGFGSRRMVPGTGIILHNRGGRFDLRAGSANIIAPGKRPYHTLAPFLALNPDGSLFMVFGTPGSDGQTQTMLQVFNNIVLFGMRPQHAVEAARWRSHPEGRLTLEAGLGERSAALRERGHATGGSRGLSPTHGGAQVILIDPETGARVTGADPRREAYGIAW